MNYKLIAGLWAIFSVSIIYWNIQRLDEREPLSDCHKAEVKVYHDRYMCTECKLFCEIVDEKN